MTFTELTQIQFPESTEEFAADYGRTLRNDMLAASDWTQTVDNPTGNAAAWATYRQQLRDAPEQANWPNVEIPTPPT